MEALSNGVMFEDNYIACDSLLHKLEDRVGKLTLENMQLSMQKEKVIEVNKWGTTLWVIIGVETLNILLLLIFNALK